MYGVVNEDIMKIKICCTAVINGVIVDELLLLTLMVLIMSEAATLLYMKCKSHAV